MLSKIVFRLNKLGLYLGSLTLFGMMLLACSNMVFRFFGHPVKGTFELMGFGGAMVTAFALGGTQQARGHIEVNLFQSVLPFRLNKVIYIFSHTLSLAFFTLLTWRIIKLAFILKESGEVSETLHFVNYPIVLLVGLGFIFMLLTLIQQILEIIAQKRS